MTSEEVEVSLSVLCGHQDVDDGVGTGAEIDQDVAQEEPEVVRGISHNLMVSWWLVDLLYCLTAVLAVSHLDNCYGKIADKKADKDDKNHLEKPPVFL